MKKQDKKGSNERKKSMSSWNLRPLLPQRQSDDRPEPPGPTSGVGPSRDYALQPRRVSVIAACDSCRDRKTKVGEMCDLVTDPRRVLLISLVSVQRRSTKMFYLLQSWMDM